MALAVVLQRLVAVTEAAALRALGSVPSISCTPDPALRDTHPEAAARMCPGGMRCTHWWHLEELSALTGMPQWLLTRRWHWSMRLTTDWALLLPLLAGGQLGVRHLEAFDRATDDANADAVTAAVQAVLDLLDKDPTVTAETLRRTAGKTVARHTDPAEAAVKQRDRVRAESGVTFEPLGDGLAALTLTGDTHKLEAIRVMLAGHPAITRPDPGDDRTHGQREIDLLVGLCLMGTGYGANTGLIRPATGRADEEPGHEGTGWAGEGWAGTSEAAEPAVGVIITASLETLLGLSNEPGTVGDTLVSAAMIRTWARDPAWARRAVTDDHGLIRTISRKQRFPARRLRLAVQARWGRCTFPTCNRAARGADLDHSHDYAHGGETILELLHPLCPKHHRMKDLPGVHVRLTADGTAIWTLPSGRTKRVTAENHHPTPGPHDGKPDDDWRADPPPISSEEAMPDVQHDQWVNDLIARDPENQAA